MPQATDPISLEGFAAGQVDRIRETDTPPTGLRYIANVNVLDGGNLDLRDGFAAVNSSTGGISAWPCYPGIPLDFGLYVTTAGALARIDKAGAATNVETSLSPDLRMSYCWFNGRAYYSNGAQYGYVDDTGTGHVWGIDAPPAPPVSTSATGGLAIGQYQACYTVTFNGGEESAPSQVVNVDLTTAGSFTLTLPTSSDFTALNVYTSDLRAPGGSVLYHYKTVAQGTTSVIVDRAHPGRELMHLNKSRMPPCTFITAFKRHILGVIDKYLFWSDVDQASICDMRHAWHNFESPITYVAPVDDGVYVGTEKQTFWCAGASPDDWTKVILHNNGIIPMDYTVYVPETSFISDAIRFQDSRAPVWWTTEADLCMGRNGGVVSRISGDKIAIQNYSRAAMVYRESNGHRWLTSTLYGPIGTNTRKTPSVTVKRSYSHGYS